jgi:hypothetical protein
MGKTQGGFYKRLPVGGVYKGWVHTEREKTVAPV